MERCHVSLSGRSFTGLLLDFRDRCQEQNVLTRLINSRISHHGTPYCCCCWLLSCGIDKTRITHIMRAWLLYLKSEDYR